MAELRIFGSEGEIVYDTAEDATGTWETDAETAGSKFSDRFKSGFVFHHDPQRGRIICYFQGQRNVPEQFFAEMRTDSPTPVAEFKQTLEDHLASLDWSIIEDAGGSQIVYNKLENVDPSPLEQFTREELERSLVEGPHPVELGTPDEATAVSLYHWLSNGIERTLRISVCRQGRTDELPASDVVIVPGASNQIGNPVGKSARVIERDKLERWIEQASQGVNKLTFSGGSSSRKNGRKAADVAEALTAADIDDLGIVVDTPERFEHRLTSQRRRAAGITFPVFLIAAVGALVAAGVTNTLTEVFQQSIYFVFPSGVSRLTSPGKWSVALGPFPVWPLLTFSWTAVVASVAIFKIGDISDVKEYLSSSNDDTNDGQIPSEKGEKLVAHLGKINDHKLIDEKGGLEDVASSNIFEDSRLVVKSSTEHDQETKREIGIGGLLGGLLAVSIIASLGAFLLIASEWLVPQVAVSLFLGVLASMYIFVVAFNVVALS